jgi:DNA polymerase IIIc chi subunit
VRNTAFDSSQNDGAQPSAIDSCLSNYKPVDQNPHRYDSETQRDLALIVVSVEKLVDNNHRIVMINSRPKISDLSKHAFTRTCTGEGA